MHKHSENPIKQLIHTEIISNKEVAGDHFVLELESKFLANNSTPGQFVNVKVTEDSTDPLLRIPLGVHKIHKTGISLLYKVVGQGTRLLSRKKRGETANILGPLGKGYDLALLKGGKNLKAILVSGGHGVAPLYGLIEALRKKKIDVDIFIGACSKNHIVIADDLAKAGANVYIATDDGSMGFKGYVTEMLDEYLVGRATSPERRAALFGCGPRPMLASLAKVAEKHKLSAQVSLDAYMACGVGACLGCAVKTKTGYKMVCKDGPVFDAKEIEWQSA